MERELYEAAYEGDIKHIKEITEQLNLIVTPNNNTILHINIMFSLWPSIDFVEEVLDICPPLLIQANDNGDTPLHLAAKDGYVDIIQLLIKHAKAQHRDLESKVTAVRQMLRMTNNDGNTALHEAAQNHNSFLSVHKATQTHSAADVVKLLMTCEDLDFPYDVANNCGETPLYIAASRGCLQVVVEMLETCTSATYNYKGPHEMTNLHAAVRRNHPDITRKILEKSGSKDSKETNENGWSLTKERDEYGWTPLHYAAYYGHHSIVKLLVEFDAAAACIADKHRKMTPLHLAAGQGHFDITRTIIVSNRACVEQVDDRGWNYVHFNMCSVTSRFGLRGFTFVTYLLDAKDVRGNTPLLVLASISQPAFDCIKKRFRREFVESTMQNIRDRQQQVHQLKNECLELSKVCDEPYKLGVICLTDRDCFELWSSLEKYIDIYLVVNALIATVTFTAGLNLPGGYIQEGWNKGTPVLLRNPAFQLFVISDAIALVLSVSAVLLHIIWLLDRLKKHLFMIKYAHIFTLWALVALNVAFVTGTYAMFRPCSGLAITTVILVLSAFPIQLYFYHKMEKAGYDDQD